MALSKKSARLIWAWYGLRDPSADGNSARNSQGKLELRRTTVLAPFWASVVLLVAVALGIICRLVEPVIVNYRRRGLLVHYLDDRSRFCTTKWEDFRITASALPDGCLFFMESKRITCTEYGINFRRWENRNYYSIGQVDWSPLGVFRVRWLRNWRFWRISNSGPSYVLADNRYHHRQHISIEEALYIIRHPDLVTAVLLENGADVESTVSKTGPSFGGVHSSTLEALRKRNTARIESIGLQLPG